MMRPALLACLAFPTWAQERPLTGDEFATIVEGKTMDTYDETGRFGVETFLPGRRTLWRDAGPFCSSFYNRGGWLLGFEDGIWGNDPIMLYPSEDVVTCDDFVGS